jgi:hypothetical protein
MRIFNLDEVYSIVCNSKSTRNGFKHVATLCKNGQNIYETKICYLNRTWERFQYESILLKIIDEFIAQCDRQKYLNVIKNFS